MYYLTRIFLLFTILFAFTNAQAEIKKFNMVFVPASEKGDENDYKGLIKIVNDLTGFEIKFIKVRAFDACTFVAFGAAQIGIAGEDVIREFAGKDTFIVKDFLRFKVGEGL